VCFASFFLTTGTFLDELLELMLILVRVTADELRSGTMIFTAHAPCAHCLGMRVNAKGTPGDIACPQLGLGVQVLYYAARIALSGRSL
jgi:hypothetical protein